MSAKRIAAIRDEIASATSVTRVARLRRELSKLESEEAAKRLPKPIPTRRKKSGNS